MAGRKTQRGRLTKLQRRNSASRKPASNFRRSKRLSTAKEVGDNESTMGSISTNVFNNNTQNPKSLQEILNNYDYQSTNSNNLIQFNQNPVGKFRRKYKKNPGAYLIPSQSRNAINYKNKQMEQQKKKYMINKSLYEQYPTMDMREVYQIAKHPAIAPEVDVMAGVSRDPEVLYERKNNEQAKYIGIPKSVINKIRQEEAAALQERQQSEAAELQERQQREAAELQQRQKEEAQKRLENRVHRSFKKRINNLYKQGNNSKKKQSKKKSRFNVTNSATN